MSAGSISQPFRRNHADRARVETPVLGLARRQGSLKIWLDKDNGWQEHCDRLHAFAVIVGAKGSSGAAYFWTAVVAALRAGELEKNFWRYLTCEHAGGDGAVEFNAAPLGHWRYPAIELYLRMRSQV